MPGLTEIAGRIATSIQKRVGGYLPGLTLFVAMGLIVVGGAVTVFVWLADEVLEGEVGHLVALVASP